MERLLSYMVIGTLDKKKGELWVACPVLYQKEFLKAYDKGYEMIFVRYPPPYLPIHLHVYSISWTISPLSFIGLRGPTPTAF